jgi:uncharacterized membrane protein YhiD involved in acid resistance
MCGESIDPAKHSSSRGVWIAVGVGVVVAAAAAAYITLADDEVEEKFQPAYGTPVTGDVIF